MIKNTQTHSKTHDPSTRGAGSAYPSDMPELAPFSFLPETDCKVFDKAIRIVFFHEGHYSNDADDPGGATKWGWSLRAAKTAGDLDLDGILDFDIDRDGDVDINDIQHLKANEAVQLYKLHYWEKFNYINLPPDVAVKAFDLAVVMGASQAHKLLQRAVRSVTGKILIDDGIIGQKTIAAISACYTPSLLSAYRSEAAGFFRLLVEIRPKSKKYLNGWLTRAYF